MDTFGLVAVQSTKTQTSRGSCWNFLQIMKTFFFSECHGGKYTVCPQKYVWGTKSSSCRPHFASRLCTFETHRLLMNSSSSCVTQWLYNLVNGLLCHGKYNWRCSQKTALSVERVQLQGLLLLLCMFYGYCIFCDIMFRCIAFRPVYLYWRSDRLFHLSTQMALHADCCEIWSWTFVD